MSKIKYIIKCKYYITICIFLFIKSLLIFFITFPVRITFCNFSHELKKKINILILDKKKIFLSAYENFKDEILKKFETVLYLQSTDLTRISEQNFEKAKDLFNEAIELLIDKD